jgi:hypothetical protein
MHAYSLLFIGFRSPKSGQNQILWHTRPDCSLGRPSAQLFPCPKSNSEKFLNFGTVFWALDVSIHTGAVQMILLAVLTIKLHHFSLAFQSR